MRIEFFAGIFIFFCAVFAGLVVGGTSLNGYVWFVENSLGGNERTPAAIKRELDFSRLDGAELITATQKRLISAARVELHDESVGVVLGHFATRDEYGQRRLACDSLYNRLTLYFQAEGFAEGGEKPSMTVDAPCRGAAQDLSSIEAVMIPYGRLLKERPANMDISYDEGVEFKFGNMGSAWPHHWSLDSVRLYNSEDSNRELRISNRELREIHKSSILVHWEGDAAPASSNQ